MTSRSPFSFVPHARGHVCVLPSARSSYPESGMAIGGERRTGLPRGNSPPDPYSVWHSKTRDADKHIHEKHCTKGDFVCAEFVRRQAAQCLATD